MSKKTNQINLILAIAIIFAITGVSWAAVIYDPVSYNFETIASYTSTGMGEVTDIVVDSAGIAYVAHRGDSSIGYRNGSVTRIDSSGIETNWLSGFDGVARMVWAGATDYGDNLYVVERLAGKIHKVNPNGTSTHFSSNSSGPICITVDKNGSYDGNMYVSTTGPDALFKVFPDGTKKYFGSWPGVMVGGGLNDLQISPTSRYNGSMIAALDQYHSSTGDPRDGLYKISTTGVATPFAPDIDNVRSLEFDTSGLMFDNDLFAIATSPPDYEGMHIFRIAEDGSIEDMGRIGWGIVDHMAFGPDGAMYLSSYTGDTTEILRVSLAPTSITIDIKPGSCVNPLNVKSKGVLTVAIHGTEDFDVFAIDVATICLNGVSSSDSPRVTPIRSSFSDVSSPAAQGQDCPSGPDGIMDLTLKFDTQQAVSVLGDLTNIPSKSNMPLTITCKLMEEATSFAGTDFVSIINPDGPKPPKCDVDHALELDGIDDHIALKDFSETGNEFTFIAWVNGKGPDWTGIFATRLAKIDGVNSSVGLYIGPDNEMRYGWDDSSNQSYNWQSGLEVPEDEWAMLALVIEPDKATAYMFSETGGLQSNINVATHNEMTIEGLKIGWTEDSSTRLFDGLIDNVRIYGRPLSASEVEEISKQGVVSDLNLLGRWDFNEGVGQVAGDSSGNGNDGQLGSSLYAESDDPVWTERQESETEDPKTPRGRRPKKQGQPQRVMLREDR